MKPNIAKIIKTMSNVVADVMTRFQSDFTDYDKPYIEGAESDKFPMLWIVAKTHTYLLCLGEYEEKFFTNEATRYNYVQSNLFPFFFFVDSMCEDDHIFLITEDEVREVNRQQARSAIKDVVIPAIEKWKAEKGSLPTKRQCQLPVKFSNISISKLKELISECKAHNDYSLINALHRFHLYTRVSSNQYVEVTYNPYYNEFVFAEYTDGKRGLVGGIIFHGWPETGYKENYAVQLEKSYGWSVHT